MKHTTSILTSLTLALACTALGCMGSDGEQEGALQRLDQGEDDAAYLADAGTSGASLLDAGRVRGGSSRDAGHARADAGHAGRGDLDDDADEDQDEGETDGGAHACRLREMWEDYMRHHPHQGHALDGGTATPRTPGFPGAPGMPGMQAPSFPGFPAGPGIPGEQPTGRSERR